MTYGEIINWLLEGDISIEYQTRRDLLDEDEKKCVALRKRIAEEGFGKRFMEAQNPNGHWGMRFYQPKWISTHYTLLDLRLIEINTTLSITKIINVIINENKGTDGGINPGAALAQSDVCINGMFINYACFFGVDENALRPVVDCVISQQMPDGGFNCMSNRSGAVHSSLHSTLSVLEGITEYLKQGYTYRAEELAEIIPQAVEFMLAHRLYKSDKTGKIIKKSFTMLSYPARWYYDILRALDYLRYAQIPYDPRMRDALDLLIKKRNKDGTWNVQVKAPGPGAFRYGADRRAQQMEHTARPSCAQIL